MFGNIAKLKNHSETLNIIAHDRWETLKMVNRLMDCDAFKMHFNINFINRVRAGFCL